MKLLAFLTIILTPQQAFAAECQNPGVLICQDNVSGGLQNYLDALLRQNMGYVILIAILLIVFSGIQYMTAMGQPAAQGAAKQRILGILGGVIFYFLISYLLLLL